MSNYFIKHEPYAERFSVYKRSWLFFKEYQRGFYYGWDTGIDKEKSQMLRAKERAVSYIEILKELE